MRWISTYEIFSALGNTVPVAGIIAITMIGKDAASAKPKLATKLLASVILDAPNQ